jgi:TatD DNase family protein
MTDHFDAHCHLQDPRLGGGAGAAARARAAGVAHMVCCATREEDWEAVLDLAREQAGVLPMLGLHPWYAPAAAPGWIGRLRAALGAARAGIGECGLDFCRPGRAAQEAAFQAQLDLAIELDLPLSIHCVRAWGRLGAMLRATGLPAAGAALHAFNGSAETAAELQGLGLHLSFEAVRPVLRAVATDRLLFESDAPSGAREPSQVALVAEGAARALGRGPELAAQAGGNARRLFRRLLP